MTRAIEMEAVTVDDVGLHIPTARPPIPEPAPQSAADVLDLWLAQAPEREAIVSKYTRLSFAELDDQANRAANALWSLGVRPGNRVAASTANHADIIVAFLGAMRIGAIWVGINRALAAPEKAYLLDDSGAQILLTDPEVREDLAGSHESVNCDLVTTIAGDENCHWSQLLRDAGCERPDVAIDPFAPAGIAYTSGTTGFPKGAVHSQHSMVLPGAVYRCNPELRGTGRAGVALPLTILNLIILGPLCTLQSGNALICIDRIDPQGLAQWIRDEKVATIAAVPTMMYDLLTHPDVADHDLDSLARPSVGGTSVPDGLRTLYESRFGIRMTTGYGLTEAPTSVTLESLDRPSPPGGSGWPLPHLKVLIQDDHGKRLAPGHSGEICVEAIDEGPWAGVYTTFLGYWQRPEATQEALAGGVLHTCDAGLLDAEGCIHVEGRASELILRGGANVYPAEVERVLGSEPSVAACAVVGEPDERLGERVIAYVEPAAGVTCDVNALDAFCRQQLARYKVPSEFRFVESFTRNSMGKIIKRDISAE